MKAVEEVRTETITASDPALEPAIPCGAQLFCAAGVEPWDSDYVLILRPNNGGQIIRQFIRKEDNSILLKAFNKDSKSYLTNDNDIRKVGELRVVLRIEYDLPALSRVDLPAEKFAVLSENTVPEPLPVSTPAAGTVSDSDYLTFEEAQELLKVKRTRMYALLQSGELEASKIGKLWRIRRSAIDRYFAARTFRKRK